MPIICALLIFFAAKSIVQSVQVEGASMHPTIKQGNRLLINKLARHHIFNPPKRGEIIAFTHPQDPSKIFIKRVIGMPGDMVEIRGGQVFVNSVKINEPYINDNERYNDNMDPFKVPESAFFVLGDNRPISSDSRDWGPSPQKTP